MRTVILFTLLFLYPAVALADVTIFSVSGNPTSGYDDIGGAGLDAMLFAGWTEAGYYSNVSVSAVITGGTGAAIDAYLTNQIGPGTTLANEIAATVVPAFGTTETKVLFSGLSLVPGSYYLVLAAPGSQLNAGWKASDSPAITADDGAYGVDGFTDLVPTSGSPDDSFPPASTFEFRTPDRMGLLFGVTGNAVATPEPSLFILVLIGFTGIILFARRAYRPKRPNL